MPDVRKQGGRPAGVVLTGAAVVLLLASTADAQQSSIQGPPPPPNRSTPVVAKELRETWNDRVSQGGPVGAMREFTGLSAVGAARRQR